MIDRETGALVLSKLRVDRDLTRSDFEKSPLATESSRNDVGTGWLHFDLPKQTSSERTFGVRLSFDGERLDGFSLWLVDPRYGTSWDDASEEKELARKGAHDAWLAEMLGKTRKFSWGEVWSTYDPRGLSSSIGVRFRRG